MDNSDLRPIVSILVECEGRTYRVIDNVRTFLRWEVDRRVSEQKIGQVVLDLSRKLDARSTEEQAK